MEKNSKIYIAGHTGLVGSALVRKFRSEGYTNLLFSHRNELDLLKQSQVENFFKLHQPEYVIIAAGKSGGVYASDTYRAQFLYENLQISINLIHSSYLYEVKKLLNIGSAHMYPKLCPQPIKEEYLLSGYLESTSEPFAIAKLAATKMCETYNSQYGTDFLTAIPSNLYGLNQDNDPLNAAVIPALIRKCHEAKLTDSAEVQLWGSGRPSRDFIFVDDFADAALFLLNNAKDNRPINIGSGKDYTILEAAKIIAKVVGFKGRITTDKTKPEGVLVKLQDTTLIENMGWKSTTELETGVRAMYEDWVRNDISDFTKRSENNPSIQI